MATSSTGVRSHAARFVAAVGLVALALAVVVGQLDRGSLSAQSNTIAINGRDSLALGLQDVYTVVLSDDAGPGPLTISVDSNEANCVVANTPSATGDANAINVVVQHGRRRATFVAQSVPGASGTCDITATAASWVTGNVSIPVVQGKLRIRDLARHHGAYSGRDPFFVEVGVPTANGNHLRYVQERSKQFSDLTVTVCSDQPTAGTITNVFGQDTGGDGCEDNPVRAPFSRTTPGDFKFAALAGSATPINVAASAPDFIGDSRNVTVSALAVTASGPEELGAGLQDNYALRLSDDAPSNLTVTISVPNTTDCVVAETEQSLGKLSIQRTVSQGRFLAEFVVQGVAVTAAGSPCVVTVDAGSFGTDTIEIDVKQPALRLRDLPSSIGQFADNAPFFVDLGVPDHRNHGLRFVQQLRKGSDPTPNTALTVNVQSSDAGIATIVDRFNVDNVPTAGEEDAEVQPGASRTVPGFLKLDPIAGNADPALITASAAGFLAIDASEKEVTVRAAALELSGPEELGASLQDDYRLELHAASGHPAATVTITSLTPNECKVAPNGSTAGTSSIDRNIAAGDSSADFVVQAAEMIADVECKIQATYTGYETANLTIMIRQPGIRVQDLRRNYSGPDADNDGFVVQVGVPTENGRDIRRVQRSRPGTSIAFDVCSSDTVVGTIVDRFNVDNGNDGCESDTITATFASNVPNWLRFDPRAVGSTIVKVTSTGFETVGTGIVEIKVGGDSINLNAPSILGSGLQALGAVRLSTQAGAGGITVTVTSETPDKCVVAAATSTSAGSSSAAVTVAEGQRSADFLVAALENLDGVTCKLKATAGGFHSDDREIEIVAAGLQFSELDASTGTTAPPHTFYAQIGIPRGSGTGLRAIQAVRWGGVAVPVTACSEDTNVGTIEGNACVTRNIEPGQFQVGFEFRVTGNAGSTKVTLNGSGDTEIRTVRVAPTVVILQGGARVLGKNLQATFFVVASNDGGLTVTAHAEPSSVCVLSLDPTVAGDATDKTVVIASGTRRTPLVVQALETGDCTVTLSGMTVPTDITTIPVVQSRLRIRSLVASIGPKAPNHPFFVETGPRNDNVADVTSNAENRAGILRPLPRRAGAPLTVEVCSSNPAVAVVRDPANSPLPTPLPVPQCVSATIASNESATDDFELDPKTNGTVDVTAKAPVETYVDDTVFTVEVRALALSINGPPAVGNYLEDELSVVFSATPGVATVTVKASGGGCGISVEADDPPVGQIDVPIAAGRRRGNFWVQGLAELPCSLTIDSPPAGFTGATTDVAIVTPAVAIRGLDSKVGVLAPNQDLRIVIGVPSANLRGVRIEQQVRPNYAGLPVTDMLPGVPLKLCSSNPAVGVILGGIADGNCRKGVIAPLHDSIDIFDFDPLTEGQTNVYIDPNGVVLAMTQRATVAVTVVGETISVQPQHDLAVGLQDLYNVVLSRNVTVQADATIESLTPLVCLVGPDDDGPFGATAPLIIKKGRSRTSFALQALTEGECRLRPTTVAAGYTPVERSIDVKPPTTRVVDLDTSLALQQKNDPFAVEIGVPGPRLRVMAHEQVARYGGGNIPVTVCSSDPTIAAIPGADGTGCKVVYITPLASRTADGDLELDPLAPGTTTVCASIPGYVEIPNSCRDVVVADVVTNINGRDRLGSYLMDDYVLAMSAVAAANYDFTVTSQTPAVCKVAPNGTTAATDSITVQVVQGRSRASFVVHGLEGVTGTCILEATPPAGTYITEAYREIEIEKPSVRIVGLDTARSTQAPNDPFNVEVGVPNGSLRGLAYSQPARYGGGGIPLSVCSSDTNVAIVVGHVSGCKPVTIAEGKDRTADGDLELDPKNDGTTVVCANPPAFFEPIQSTCREVVVSGVVSNINGRDDLGEGLQEQYYLVLSSPLATDTTFVIATTTATKCLVAADGNSAGAPSINVTVPKNRARAPFHVQGLETGTCNLTATAPVGSGVLDAVRDLEIAQPGLRLANLDTSLATQALDEPFNVEIGLPQSSLRSLKVAQEARIGGGDVPITVCSSYPNIASIVGAGMDGCKVVYVHPGDSQTLDGDLKLNPNTGGTTTICATSPGYLQTTQQGCRDVKVSDLVANINGHAELAARLQDTYVLALSAALVSTSNFTITSDTPAYCKVALNPTSASANSISVQVLQGRSRAELVVHGLAGASGNTCVLSITPPGGSGIIANPREIAIVAGADKIINLDTSAAPEGPTDPFNVLIGVPDGRLRGLAYSEAARIGGGTVPVTVCSSDTNVGIIIGHVAGCKTVYVPEGSDRTVDSDLVFDALNGGTTVICASTPGFDDIEQSCREVRVSPLVANINGHDDLGTGLQDAYVLALNRVVLNSTTFTVTAATPAVCKVAVDAVSAGANSINVTVPAGRGRADFVVQALENVTGTCIVTATAPAGSGIVDAYREINVIMPAIRIINLDTSRGTGSPNDPFNVQIGIADRGARSLAFAQATRYGGPGKQVTVCSTLLAVGEIVDDDAYGCKDVVVPAGKDRTAEGALQFHAVSGGTTTIYAYGADLISTNAASRDVRVSSWVTTLNGHDEIGIGLQDQYVLALNKAVTSNSNFTVTSLTPAVCKVAPDAVTVGSTAITVQVLQNRSRADFVVSGWTPGLCILTTTAPAGSGIIDAYREIEVVPLSLRIINLDTSRGTLSANDPFNVQVGVPNASLRGLAFAQTARAGGGGVGVTVCSSAPSYGIIVGQNPVTYCKLVTIPVGEDQTPAGGLEFQSVAAGTTTICASTPGFTPIDPSCREVRVSGIVSNINGRDNLGAGLHDEYALVTSSAMTADTTFTVTTGTPGECKLANTATSTPANTIYVVVLKGRSRATFYVQGLLAGLCEITATPPGTAITEALREIDIDTPALRIINLDTSRSTQAAHDPFNVEIGLPQASLKSLAAVQAARTGGGTVPITVCSSNTTVGDIVGAVGGCKTVYVAEGQSRTAEGDLQFDAKNDGSTTVCASAAGYLQTAAACRDVNVAGIVPNLNGPDSLGMTLQDEYTLSLSSAVAADTLFTITSTTTAICRVATLRASGGSTSVNVTVPAGRSRASLFVQGWDDTGTCNLTITTAAGGISYGTRDLEVVTPGLRIINLAGTQKTTAPDDPFDVELGIPTGNLRTLARVQERRGGAPLLTVYACSSAVGYGTVVGGGADPACKTATIAATNSRTTAGALAFHPVGAGSLTIAASATDFITTEAGYKDITVATGTISVAGADALGAGLQDTFTVNVNPRAPTGGLPITCASQTPTLCKVAPNISTAGATSYAFTLAKGKLSAKIAIQALENVSGTCVVRCTTTNPDWVGEDFEVDVRQPAVRIRNLDATTTVASANDGFFADVGVARDNLRSLRLVQTVRAGAANLTVTACSSNTGAGVVLGTATADPACKSATIPAGESGTATNALVFDPGGSGTTIVSVSAPGYLTTEDGSVEVYIAAAALSMTETTTERIGAGLMETFNIKSSATVGANTVVAITSQTPDVCLVATSETTASAASVNVTILAGRSRETFVIHGMENKVGACLLRAVSAGFGDGYASYDVVQPALRIEGLGTSKTTTSADDAFNVDVGVPKATLANIQTRQKVRIGSAGVPVTVCSSDEYVGKIVTLSVAAACRTITIPAGQMQTAASDFKFRVVAGGTATVDASAPGFIVTDAGTVDVTVSGAGLSLDITTANINPIGAGLQRGAFNVERTGSTASAITATVTSLTPTLCKVSASGTVAGSTSVVLNIASGSALSPAFWVQGMDAVLGICELEVTATNYPSGNGSVTIVKPAIRLLNLAASMANTAANDPFNVEIGIPDSGQTTVAEAQQVRAGSSGFSIAVSNGNSAAAQLVGSNASNVEVSGQSITVNINAGASSNTTGAQQRLELDPNNSLGASAGTSVSATNADTISTSGASQVVTVTVGGGC